MIQIFKLKKIKNILDFSIKIYFSQKVKKKKKKVIKDHPNMYHIT